MIDTPRTEAVRSITDGGIAELCKEYEFLARQLERELAAANKELATLRGAQKFGCHCDLEDDQAPDGCVLDVGCPQDCIYAQKLLREGKGKTACEYWQPIIGPKAKA